MKTPVCEMLGVEFPLFAFSHCRDVVVAVSKAGGFGVFGVGNISDPEELEIELRWIDEHIDGKPYGVNVLVPENMAVGMGASTEEMSALIPDEHRKFVVDLLAKYDVKISSSDFDEPLQASLVVGEQMMDVAFRHPIKLICSALGIAPQSMIDRGRQHGVPVAALVGAPEHAIRQAKAGVDILVAQGTEAGGHCGEVSTLVLVPEVLRAVSEYNIPVLAAGGIVTGRQMVACMALGAAGVWTGSVWLPTVESETSPVIKDKLIAARSRDTFRSKFRSGKMNRQLRSAWHDAWEAPGAPRPLGMPMQVCLSVPAFARIDKASLSGNEKARELVSYFVGQGVGLINSIKSAGAVVQEFKEEFADSVEHIVEIIED